MDTSQAELQTRVCVGVMIFKDGKVLLSKRKNAVGEGSYAFPGGHLEYRESFDACARREITEECGIEVTNLRFQYVANLNAPATKHYVHIGMIADWASGEPQRLEPEKSEGWDWYALDALPTPLFVTCTLAIESYQTGRSYQDDVASLSLQ